MNQTPARPQPQPRPQPPYASRRVLAGYGPVERNVKPRRPPRPRRPAQPSNNPRPGTPQHAMAAPPVLWLQRTLRPVHLVILRTLNVILGVGPINHTRPSRGGRRSGPRVRPLPPRPGARGTPFGVELRDDAGVAVVLLTGEFDLAVQDQVAAAIAVALQRAPTVVVDLSDLWFIDSSGLNILLRGRTAARDAGRRLVLRGASGAVAQTLAITALMIRRDEPLTRR
jgi:anti-anti-sigma factor